MKKGIILFNGIVSGPYGYSTYARNVFDSLIAAYGLTYHVFNVRLKNSQYFIDTQSELYTKLISEFKIAKCMITVGLPTQLPQIDRSKILTHVLVTASILSDKVVENWINHMNSMDLVITMSEFSKQVMYNALTDIIKLITDVKVVNHCIDMYGEVDSFNLDGIKEDKCFLFFGQWLQGALGLDRKNIGLMIHDFLSTFKNTKLKPALLIKTHTDFYSKVGQYLIFDKIDSIKKSIDMNYKNIDWPNIYLIYGLLTQDLIIGLYRNDKVIAMISLTHGEGWGIPLALFITNTTKPMLCSNWSAMPLFLLDEYKLQYALRGSLVNVSPNIIPYYLNLMRADSQWFECDHLYTKRKLLLTYYTYDLHKLLCLKQQNHMIENYNTSIMKQQLKDALLDILK